VLGAEGLLVEEGRGAKIERMVDFGAFGGLHERYRLDNQLLEKPPAVTPIRPGLPMGSVLPFKSCKCAERTNSLRLPCPPEPSWLSRIRMRTGCNSRGCNRGAVQEVAIHGELTVAECFVPFSVANAR
jgi:hypothetical protein